MRKFELVVMGILSVFFVMALFQGVPDLPTRNLDGTMRSFGEAVTTAAVQRNAAPGPMTNEEIQIAIDNAVQEQMDANAFANIEPAAGGQSEPELENIGYIGDDGICYCTVESIE